MNNDIYSCFTQSKKPIKRCVIFYTIRWCWLIFFQEIVDEIDEDESGLLEFPEFVQLAAKFLIEEDEEQMKWELKEAFRIYDKHGKEFFFYVKSNQRTFLFYYIFL